MSAPLRNIFLKLKSITYFHNGNLRAVSSSSTSIVKDNWQLYGAVCLERFAIVSSPQSELESKMADMLGELEFENSLLSDHEIRHLDDLKLAESRKSDDYIESEKDSIRQTANEVEDIWENEMNNFKPAPIITEDDNTNNLKSMDRQLDRKLLLLVKQNLGDETHWLLPQKLWSEGETLRETAEKALEDFCGPSINAKYMGNAPCAVYKYKYPKHLMEKYGSIGAKIFFFKAQTQKNTSIQFNDHIWINKEHIQNYTKHKYGQHLKRVMLDF